MMVEAALSFQSALSILIIEVICLGVTNLLQKRETKKLQKEQVSKKEGGENRKVIAGSGPRDFEQKIDEDDETDD